VSTHGRQGRATVATGRAGTDAAQAVFRGSARSATARQAMNQVTRERLDDLFGRLDGLAGIRAQADSGTVDTVGAVKDYNAVIDSLTHLLSGLILIDDPGVYRQSAAIIAASTAHELMMRENALVMAALATKERKLSAPAYAMFVRSANNGRYLFDAGSAEMKPSLRGPLHRLAASSDFTTFRGLEDEIVTGGPGVSLVPQAQKWPATVTPLMMSWPRATDQAGAVLTAEAKPIGDRIMYLLYAAGGLGLVAVVLSITMSVLFGRSLARELARLQRAALDLAGNRLPRVIERLRGGEKVDVAAEVPPLNVGKSKEISRVADALITVQRAAIEAAVGEARLRQGINQVILNLAWRSQSLLHRQLSMLDTMERQASDPDALEDLFALDHLTTRMRRHAEGLVILSGSAPARGWHHPVAVRDILRAAIVEVEDYTRVVVDAASPAALDGGVMADVTHLLAELVENATAFSPPPTQVHIRGELVATGYAMEVEDRGIGMNAAELAEANERLSHPPEFDLADNDRLGLFIVGRIAARQGIGVTLEPSPYGGTRAVVLIPLDYVVRDDGAGYEDTWADEPVADPGWPPAPRAATTPSEIAVAAQGGDRTAGATPEPLRQIRQVDLAPQLRRDTPTRGEAGTGPTTVRSPEETRSLMTSLQQGWQRGRQDEDPDE
jgi:signal transduction histidine kinase